MSFVHLHNHTDYSLLDGMASIEELVEKAAFLGQKALAITDHGNMFGVLNFYKACKKSGIKPIIGSEFYMAAASRFEKTGTESGNKYYHLLLLAKNETGYKNLMRLSSRSFTEGFYYKPRVDWELLELYHEGIICSTACIAGEVPQYFLMNRDKDAEIAAARYMDIFGKENFFIEIQDHGIPEEKRVNPKLVKLAKHLGVNLIATNDIHYVEKDDADIHDALLCVGTNKKLADQDRMRFYGPDFYLKTGEEMETLFSWIPEACKNTVLVSEMVDLEIPLPGPLLPDYSIPPEFNTVSPEEVDGFAARVSDYHRNMSDDDICKPNPRYGKEDINILAPLLREQLARRMMLPITRYFIWTVNKGLLDRYSEPGDEQKKRLDYELAVIILMDYVGYYLIVSDFINWAKAQDIPVGPGRGSGAGSIIAYCLGITDIDPLRYGLLFERFLNPERISMPDFDVDFCFERRGEVIDYVTEKYGKDRVGQIVTFGTLKAKMALRDIARVLGIPIADSNEITKLVPNIPDISFRKAFEMEPRLGMMESKSQYSELFRMARRIENTKRHSSLHAAGVVIGKTDLIDYVPVYKDSKSGNVATQFTMGQLEECGLVKMDFLGLKTLTLVKNTLALMKKRGVEMLPEDIPDDDRKTYEMLGEGRSSGIFQFESDGMQNYLKQLKPNRIEDLIAMNALYRPGPMEGIPQYIACKLGKAEPKYPHPSLEGILKETYGIMVYQEQVMEATRILAGYTLGGADILRRAISKKDQKVMDAQKLVFIKGCNEIHGMPENEAEEIFSLISHFADYGFNKSHSAAYAVLAYKTAWLKANYPHEYMAANLTNEIDKTDKLSQYIAETRSMGIEVLKPDINFSDTVFTVVDDKITYGLLGIKGIGEAVAREIIKNREENGPYLGFMDFLERVGIISANKGSVEALIQAGCFDSFGNKRAELLVNLEGSWQYLQRKLEFTAFGQTSLFDDSPKENPVDFMYDAVDEWPMQEILRKEKQLLGFYFSGHPLDEYKDLYYRCCDIDFKRLDKSTPNKTYTLIGLLTEFSEFINRFQKESGTGRVEGYDGSIKIFLNESVLGKYRSNFRNEEIVFLSGTIDTRQDPPTFKVSDYIYHGDLQDRNYRELHITLAEISSEDELAGLKDLLLGSKGPCQVVFHVKNSEREELVKAHASISVDKSDALLEKLRMNGLVQDLWFV